jgi:hypothetical protein
MTQLDRLMGVLRLATTAILSAILRDHTAPAARPNPDAPDAPDAFLDIVAISAAHLCVFIRACVRMRQSDA